MAKRLERKEARVGIRKDFDGGRGGGGGGGGVACVEGITKGLASKEPRACESKDFEGAKRNKSPQCPLKKK